MLVVGVQVLGGYLPLVHVPRCNLRVRPLLQQDRFGACSQRRTVRYTGQSGASIAVAHGEVQQR